MPTFQWPWRPDKPDEDERIILIEELEGIKIEENLGDNDNYPSKRRIIVYLPNWLKAWFDAERRARLASLSPWKAWFRRIFLGLLAVVLLAAVGIWLRTSPWFGRVVWNLIKWLGDFIVGLSFWLTY